MVILGRPQQHVATWRVILGLTACNMSSQFLHVVHRFCIFWCIHKMYSATIAQSSPKYGRPYYLFGSLFLISCFLVSLGCSAHAYALTMRLYNLVITLFSVVFGPNIELLTQMLCRPESYHSVLCLLWNSYLLGNHQDIITDIVGVRIFPPGALLWIRLCKCESQLLIYVLRGPMRSHDLIQR